MRPLITAAPFLALMLCCAWGSVPVRAAPPAEDPRALRGMVVSSCLRSSTLEDAWPMGETFRYGERVGHTALLLAGRRTRSSGDGGKGYELCLYDERAGTASVVAADELIEGP